jgi:hypothetical protein
MSKYCRHPEPEPPDGHVEHDDSVIRSISVGVGWTGVVWSDLDDVTADAVIAAQISRFAEPTRAWEWKHYSYDQPSNFPDRLLAGGFTREHERRAGPASAGYANPRRARTGRAPVPSIVVIAERSRRQDG